MFLRFRSFSRIHGRIRVPQGALSTNLSEIRSLHSGSGITDNLGGLPHDIVTLDPKKFVRKKQQCLHIGDLKSFAPRIWLLNQSPVAAEHLFYDHTHRTRKNAFPLYPPDTKAFLYYSKPPEKPRIAGELRLRVTSRNDAAYFESGSDLLRPDGQIWSRPLHSLPKYFPILYERLREDRLIPDDLDKSLAALPSQHRIRRFLFTLNDTFTLDFSSPRTVFYIITEKGVRTLPLDSVFLDNRDKRRCRPYKGNALARFERSTLPDHYGARNVVLRFLKLITPVKCAIPYYDGHICCPKEGELYQRTGGKAGQKVWSVNIDESRGPRTGKTVPGLKLLWDA